ncbi:DUF5990 family protein [Nocardia jejuensis]|uniref:DUF5990 family protein n=1 Tax=Nocardia jejuensis TaxID=328049 RepID=UPI00082A1795|nr:DUF5990 family protein [Nocardia jejuensis]
MLLRIEGRHLPGLNCPPSPTFPGYSNIHIAVQRKDRPQELLDLQPGDAPQVSWTLEAEPADTSAGIVLRGPYIQSRGGPFVYLNWGELAADTTFTMFRRAKLWLDAIEPATMAAALDVGTLIARLDLTDAEGEPVCASVRPPRLELSVPQS